MYVYECSHPSHSVLLCYHQLCMEPLHIHRLIVPETSLSITRKFIILTSGQATLCLFSPYMMFSFPKDHSFQHMERWPRWMRWH